MKERAIRRKKLKRAVQRSFVTFQIMFVVYIAINAVIFAANNADWASEALNTRALFNFLVLNVWPFPIGSNIWFIQALLYAYVFLLLADRLFPQHFELTEKFAGIIVYLICLLICVLITAVKKRVTDKMRKFKWGGVKRSNAGTQKK